VVSVGTSVQAYHRESRLLTPSKHHLLPKNEIDLEKFHPPRGAFAADPLGLILEGRLHAFKGPDTVISAFGRLTFDGRRRSVERRMTGDRLPKLEAFYETLVARG
jgi:hypothetical protein